MKFHVVTTMNEKGWIETGQKMAESFVARWPTDCELTIYAEDFSPGVDGVSVRSLPGWMAEFKARHSGTPAYNGKLGTVYDYRFDAVKFAHKVAAVTDFGAGLNDGVMIWLDADIYTHSEVTADWLTKLFPAPSYIAWLDRRSTHPECGMVMYRCSHTYHHSFMASFRRLYESDEVFKMRETHDSYVLQQLVLTKAAGRKIEAPVSLSGAAVGTSHVFVNSEIGSRMDHWKGPRKAEGRSRKRDLVFPRKEPYWQS